MDDKELQQFEIDEAKAKEGPFGFRVGNDERLHAGENIQEQAGHMSSSYTSKEAQKAEAKKEQQKHAIHTMLNQYGLSNHVEDLLHEVEKLREDEQKLEQEKSDLITEDAILEKETRILEVRKDILSKQIEAIEMICDEEMCMIDHDLAAIRENIEQIDTLKEEFAKQDPEAYRAYKEHRHLAKEIISLKINLDNDPASRAKPVVFINENGEYYVKSNDGTETHLVKDMANAKDLIADIERQAKGNGQFHGESDAIVKAWQETHEGYYNTDSPAGRRILDFKLDDIRREYKNAVKGHAETLEKLTDEKSILKTELEEINKDLESNHTRRSEIKGRLTEIADDLVKIRDEIKAKISEAIPDPEHQKALFEYLQDNPGKSTEELMRDMPEDLKNSLNNVAPENTKERDADSSPKSQHSTISLDPEKNEISLTNNHFNKAAQGTAPTEEPKAPSAVKSLTATANLEFKGGVIPLDISAQNNSISIQNGQIILTQNDGTTIPTGLEIDQNQRLILDGAPTGTYMKDPGHFERKNPDGSIVQVDVKIESGDEGEVNIEINDIIPNELNMHCTSHNGLTI